MIYGDLHIHSIYSNGYFPGLWVTSTPRQILQKAQQRGLRVVAIPDHDSLEGSRQAEKIARSFGIIVIPACEVSTTDGHLLAYGIKKEIPKKLKAKETVELIHQQGGLAIAAHPFKFGWVHMLPGINHSLGEKVYQIPIDGLEVINANTRMYFNLLAERNARKRPDFIQIGGSDSHVLDFIGYGVTVFKKEVRSAQEALKLMRNRQVTAKLNHRTSPIKLVGAEIRDQFRFLFNRLG
jgi:predicted metal-dependent phosphoesterase TrpH